MDNIGSEHKVDPEQDEYKEIFDCACERLYTSQDGWDFVVNRMKDELEFASGRQWTPEDEALRDGRPCLTTDKTAKYIDKISGFFRQNPPQVQVKPKYNGSKLTAQAIRYYVSQLMTESNNKAAIQTAGEHLAKTGYGWIFVNYKKEGSRSFDEYKPVFERVDDPRSVRIDPAHTEVDGSDAQWVMLLRRVEHEEAERLYGEDVSSFDQLPSQYYNTWSAGDQIIVANYWYKEVVSDTLYEVVMNGDKSKKRLWQEELDALEANSYTIKRQSKQDREIVRYALMSGAGIIEAYDWPGLDLPIAPVYGKQAWLDGKKFYMGMLRAMMDNQRLINFYVSTAAEVTALAPRIPYIMAEGQAEGHEDEFDLANVRNLSRLEYKPVSIGGQVVPPPSRQQTSSDVTPLIASIQNATTDLADVTGIYDVSLGNEKGSQNSGIAVENMTANSDQVLAIMVDNLRRGVIRATQIAINMLPKLISDERLIKIKADDDTEHEIPVNTQQPVDYQEIAGMGEVGIIDFTMGEYEVALVDGKSYSTKKATGAANGMEMLSLLPDMQKSAIAPEVAKNQEWNNSDKMYNILLATLPPEVRKAYSGVNSKEDPQATAIMDQMKQEIETLTSENAQIMDVLQQLQMAVISTKEDNYTKLQIANQQDATKRYEIDVKAGIETATTEADNSTKVVLQREKQENDLANKRLEAAMNASKELLGGLSMGQGNIIRMPSQIHGIPISNNLPR